MSLKLFECPPPPFAETQLTKGLVLAKTATLFRVWRILRHRNRNRFCSPRYLKDGKTFGREGRNRKASNDLPVARCNPRAWRYRKEILVALIYCLCIKISLFYCKDSTVITIFIILSYFIKQCLSVIFFLLLLLSLEILNQIR